jgi:hypothetical protein
VKQTDESGDSSACVRAPPMVRTAPSAATVTPVQSSVRFLAFEDIAGFRRVHRITLLRDAGMIGASRRVARAGSSPTRSTVTPDNGRRDAGHSQRNPDQNIAPRCSSEDDAVGFSCANAGVAASTSTSQHRNA